MNNMNQRKYASKAERIAAFRGIMGAVYQPAQVEHLADCLDEMGFFDAPASTKYHGCYYGGLYEHSEAVTINLLELTEKLGLQWQREKSPYLVGMLHDLCKCDQYVKTADGKWEFSKDQILSGHGEKSVILAQRLVDLTAEEMLCIRWHMGAYEDPKLFGVLGSAIERFPNVLYTHTADMIASKILGV